MTINNTKELNVAIIMLTNQQHLEELSLKKEFISSYESLKPINILKNTVKEFVEAPDFKEDILKTSISIASGYLTKKITVGDSKNPLKQLLGSFLQMGVTSIVSKNADSIKSKSIDLLSILLDRKK